MKKGYRLIILLFTMAAYCCQNGAKASHVMGSDIVYRCLGGGRYEITVKAYRDCNGVGINQEDVVLTCGANTITITNQTKVSVRDITGIDPKCGISSACAGGWPTFAYGVEEHIWTMQVDLSSYS